MSDQPTPDLPDPGKQLDDPAGEFSELAPDPAKGPDDADGNDAEAESYDSESADEAGPGE